MNRDKCDNCKKKEGGCINSPSNKYCPKRTGIHKPKGGTTGIGGVKRGTRRNKGNKNMRDK